MSVDLVAGTGLIRTDDHRYYWNNLGPFPGVTTVQKVLSKDEALVNWAKGMVAEYAVDNAYKVAWQVQAGDVEGARSFLKAIPDRYRDERADEGGLTHYFAELIGLGKLPTVPDQHWPFVRQYIAWRQEWQHEVLSVEYMGVNLTHGYGGTGDLIVQRNGQNWLIDIKTRRKPVRGGKYYPETALQLVACARLDFIGKPNDQTQHQIPTIDRYAVLVLLPDRWLLVEYQFDVEATFAAFAALCAVYRWKRELKGVMRPAIEGRAEEAHDDAA